MNTKSTRSQSSTVALLEHLYQITATEANTVRAMLPKVESESATFKSELTLWLSGCEALNARAGALMSEAGDLPPKDSMMSRMTAKITSSLDTLTDSSVGHIAELLLQNATASMADAVRLLREFENTTASEASLALARDVIKHEEEQVERIKDFL